MSSRTPSGRLIRLACLLARHQNKQTCLAIPVKLEDAFTNDFLRQALLPPSINYLKSLVSVNT